MKDATLPAEWHAIATCHRQTFSVALTVLSIHVLLLFAIRQGIRVSLPHPAKPLQVLTAFIVTPVPKINQTPPQQHRIAAQTKPSAKTTKTMSAISPAVAQNLVTAPHSQPDAAPLQTVFSVKQQTDIAPVGAQSDSTVAANSSKNKVTVAPQNTEVTTTVTSYAAAADIVVSKKLPLVSATAVKPIELPIGDANYLNNPQPGYPAISKRLGEQGKVIVRAYIGIDGHAQKAEVRESSGYDRLDEVARTTVLNKWQFVPGKRGEIAEAMWVNIPINFILE